LVDQEVCKRRTKKTNLSAGGEFSGMFDWPGLNKMGPSGARGDKFESWLTKLTKMCPSGAKRYNIYIMCDKVA
jgi:hypothetical protein